MSKERHEPFGRPTIYCEELADKICELVSTHTESIMHLIERHNLPDNTTIRAWRLKYPDFSSKYLEAKRLQADLLVEEIDDLIREVNYYHDSEGNQRIDAPSVSLAIARANNRKWVAARLLPKLYGDKSSAEVINDINTTEVAEKVAKIIKDSEKEY